MTLKAFLSLALFSLSLLASGCGSLLPKPHAAPTLCVLSPPHMPASLGDPVDWHLAVDLPSGSASYDTTKIPVMRSAQQLEYYSDCEWTERLPLLLQSLIVKSLENSGRITGVARASAGINPDKLLMTDIRQCHVETHGSKPLVRISVTIKLVDMKDRRIVKSTLLTRETPLTGERRDHIVNAFQTTLSAILQDMVQWCLE